jgi:valyl-tRNA synthetase
MDEQEIPKAYDAKAHEDAIYAAWEQSGFFNPDKLPGERREPFTIVLPPPNVTGTLHLGHAVMLAIEDVMIRFARMRGKKALWVPGTDHAAIATQSKVEKLLVEKGMKDPRRELGRERFLGEVEKFASESHDVIVNQCRKMGASLDWSREAYTLDEKRNRAVNAVFKMMYDDGLIYRGKRIVNWDPVGQTTISDDEIVYKEEKAKFYYFKYGPFEIGTARPETKFGDKVVVVHPDDKRYTDFTHGQKLTVEWINGPIEATVIKDPVADMSFGSGAMTITPWHSTVDFDLAQKHGIEGEQIIGLDGRLLLVAGEFAGMHIRDAREKIVAKLEAKGLLVRVDEHYVHNLATAERTDGIVEPQVLKQWFVAVNKPFRRGFLRKTTLKKLMQDAVRSGKIKINPERFEKTYFHWIDNLRDWCISRQIWFGHRIPVWYRGEEIHVGAESPGEGWKQDEDTLDTWFSSGLWTFSTLGWPDQTADLKTFHPTSVLETGYDILFFWVARMILMTEYVMKDVPFTEVYLHGLVRDEQGRKMSKSLGNVINPLDMIEKYGADATRLALLIGSTPGNDSKLSEEKIAGFRNFTNKLWNISRFVLTTTKEGGNAEPKTLADRWILSRFNVVAREVAKKLEAKEFSAAGELLREFTWNDFADWYLEVAKVEQGKDAILRTILEGLMKLWHPFMPFVTETIWGMMGKKDLIVASYPTDVGKSDREAEAEMATLQGIVTALRGIRAEYKVPPGQEMHAVIVSKPHGAFLSSVSDVVRRLARLGNLSIQPMGEKPENSAGAEVNGASIFVPLAGLVDTEKERARLTKEIAQLRGYVAGTEAKLGNAEFTKKAPEKVVADMRAKLEEAKSRAAALENQLASLN